MSKIIEKRISDICDIISENHKYTKEYINKHEGRYPIYSATLSKPFGYIDEYTYSDDMLMVAKYGNPGNTYMVENCKFSVGRNVCGLIIKEEYKSQISLEYIQLVATPEFVKSVKGEGQKKLNQKMVAETVIRIPVTEDNSYDMEEQKRLAGIYSEIENQKQKLLSKVFEIQELLIHIDKESGIEYRDVSLNDIVTHNNGNATYTKTWCQKHKGDYPLYSANNYEPFAFIDSFDYYGEYLTYSKNGCAGYITLIKGCFSVNGDRCVITINDKYSASIDLLYLKYYLEPIFRSNKKGRLGAFGKNEFTKLNSTMIKELNIQIPIPLNQDGSYDIEKQKEIADRYKQIDEIKKGLIDKIENLISINISPETIEE